MLRRWPVISTGRMHSVVGLITERDVPGHSRQWISPRLARERLPESRGTITRRPPRPAAASAHISSATVVGQRTDWEAAGMMQQQQRVEVWQNGVWGRSASHVLGFGGEWWAGGAGCFSELRARGATALETLLVGCRASAPPNSSGHAIMLAPYGVSGEIVEYLLNLFGYGASKNPRRRRTAATYSPRQPLTCYKQEVTQRRAIVKMK